MEVTCTDRGFLHLQQLPSSPPPPADTCNLQSPCSPALLAPKSWARIPEATTLTPSYNLHPLEQIQVWNFPSALCLSVSCFVCVIGRWWVGGTLRAGGAKVQGPMAVVHYSDCSGSPAEPGGLPDNLIIPQFPPPGSLQCNVHQPNMVGDHV